jgi:hypothetical protein
MYTNVYSLEYFFEDSKGNVYVSTSTSSSNSDRGIFMLKEKECSLIYSTGYNWRYFFEDSKGNQFVWTTSAKDWQQGETKHIRGTVKEYQFSKGNKQTVLTRCVEVK